VSVQYLASAAPSALVSTPIDSKISVTCFQLREYARWLSEFHGFARFHQLPEDWLVPAQADVKPPSWANKEKDREEANSDLSPKYHDCYSTMRILRDGGHLNLDAYGNCYCSGKHGIHISSTRDMVFEAAGDMRLVVGQNLYILARRSIEIVAAVGALVMKARTALRALCEWGSIYLKSDHDPDNLKAKTDQPFPDEDPAPEVMDASVVIDAPAGTISVQSRNKLAITSEEKDIHLQALKDSVLIGAKKMLAVSVLEGRFGVKSKSCVISSKDSLLMDTDLLDVSRSMTYRRRQGDRSNVVTITDLRANRVCSQDVYSRKIGPVPIADGVDSGKPHINHVQEIKPEEDYKPRAATNEDRKDAQTFIQELAAKRATDRFLQNPLLKKTKFTLLPQGEYVHAVTPLYQTLSQQQLALDGIDPSLQVETWSWDTNKLETAKRTAGDSPHVGVKKQHLVCATEAPSMQTPSDRPPGDEWKPTKLRPQPVEIRFLKHAPPTA